MAYNSGDSGQPCLTPAVIVKPRTCAPFVCTVQRLLSYNALIMFNALVGTPVADSSLNMYSCEMDGKADAKSNSTNAPLLLVRAVVMAA